MKAWRAMRYGGPEVLELVDAPRPTAAANEVVVEVIAASLNPLDWHQLRGEPWLVRITGGLRRPKTGAVGTDVAGVVVETGTGVTHLRVGDRVVGTATHSLAAFAAARADRVVPLPDGLDAVAAAGLPVAGVTALQALRLGNVGSSTRVLVIGASGGVGTFAVQLAAANGAVVTGVCSTANVVLVRELGATEVIDRTTNELDRLTGPFDAIVDCVGSLSFRRCKALLVRGGRYVVVGGPDGGRLLGPLTHLARAKLAFVLGGRSAHPMIATITADDLNELTAAFAADRLRVVVDRVVPLDDVPDAIRHLETKRARGKVLVEVRLG
ncbi:MAG: NAD(P)-dependent alcohol dehydrogenase [Actinobacteria bacterium]|nr:NAD(P)-dependent alcohol dehydrogenase [Actinomycetota bacterium]